MSTLGSGVVISLHSRKCLVIPDGEEEEVPCMLRGRLFEKLKGDTKPIAVGDRVRFRLTSEGAAVEEILPRRNSLTRPAVGRRGTAQTIAANIDRMVVVASMKDPPLKSGLIDRFLVAASVEDFGALICLNKIDLVAEFEEEARLLEEAFSLYSSLKYDVLPTSAVDGRGIEALSSALQSGISLVVGHSGVGKSTLINRVSPDRQLKTSEISGKHHKGRHTTTSVSLLKLRGGGFVVDTPGIREFGIHDMRPADLGLHFPEIAALLPYCSYADCTHRHEPQCAVLGGLEQGTVTRRRYESYLRILGEIEEERRS